MNELDVYSSKGAKTGIVILVSNFIFSKFIIFC